MKTEITQKKKMYGTGYNVVVSAMPRNVRDLCKMSAARFRSREIGITSVKITSFKSAREANKYIKEIGEILDRR